MSHRRTTRAARYAIAGWAIVGFAGLVSPASARGGLPPDEPWNPQHISELPAEIRSALARMCPGPLKAQHYFAGYYQNSQTVVLHFENLRCGERGALCTNAGCLHQLYGLSGGHYRLLKSFYGPGND
jgi:hypothetical protein